MGLEMCIRDSSENIPWADDMLCGATRFRHGAMLKSRGRALAKGLARLLRGVSSDLQGVASRLPPWQEDKVEIDALTQEEVGDVWGRGCGRVQCVQRQVRTEQDPLRCVNVLIGWFSVVFLTFLTPVCFGS